MLTLTRRVGETLIIETPAGEQIELTVLGIKGKQVQLGASGNKDIKVIREELLQQSA